MRHGPNPADQTLDDSVANGADLELAFGEEDGNMEAVVDPEGEYIAHLLQQFRKPEQGSSAGVA